MRGLPKTWRILIPERQSMESWAVWGKIKGNRTPEFGGGSSVSTSKPRSEQETLEEIPLFLPTEEFQHIMQLWMDFTILISFVATSRPYLTC